MPIEILDGAMGTELIAHGVDLEGPVWSARAVLEAPEAVAEVHRAYAQAGATIHTTNTFRTQPQYLSNWAEAAMTAVGLARGSVPSGHRVAGSIAPAADCYRPDLSPGVEARADHRALAEVLADAGCDLLLCETFAVRDEALVAVEEALRTGVETWLALTAGPDGVLLDPASMARIADDAVRLGVRRVLANCISAARIQPFVGAICAIGVPCGVYANAGDASEGLGWGNERGPARYADLALEWVRQGATVIGGCCGTGPDHTRALCDRLVEG